MRQGTHEDHTEHSVHQGPSDRAFGLTVGVVLLLIAAFRLLKKGASVEHLLAFFVPGCLLILVALIAPGTLSLLNRGWSALGLLMARIVNPVMLFLMYCIAFVPLGLAMRIFGRDLLQLRPLPKEKSYWIDRHPPGPAPADLHRQF